ncbi:thermonuclease family protein [Cyanobium sp. Morenito 9A2]|uniref:thermonuclease family protein n=1 Tax=Cyanobium sp. Morenito 9A2 TaxID=2823718 RepID=UPI0020CED6BC|nr:thermonuclease family protein [Cyanobium sp. Morenito 9A2]
MAEVIGSVNLNLAMVEDGQAFAYRRYLGACNARSFLDAEFRASRHRHGVWQITNGITRPWDFRQGRPTSRGRPSVDLGGGAAALPARPMAPGAGHRCQQIGSFALAQELLRQGHNHPDGDGDGVAYERLRGGQPAPGSRCRRRPGAGRRSPEPERQAPSRRGRAAPPLGLRDA